MKFAIIGGGATSVSLVDALDRRGLTQEIDLAVYEPEKEIGRGNAYRVDAGSALLNRQAEFMSIRWNEPRHFLGWLEKHPDPEVRAYAHPGTFPPRYLFGDYTSESFARLRDSWGDHGRSIEVFHDTAVSMTRGHEGRGIGITTASGTTHTYDGAALCVGTAEPVDCYGLAGNPRYTNDPYPLWVTVETVDPDDHVAVLGTSLTAVDIVMALLDRGHRGPITMVSRRGLLPGVRQQHRDTTSAVLTETAVRRAADAPEGLTLAAVLELMRAELAAHGIDPGILDGEADPGEEPAARLARHLDLAERAELWQPLLITAANDLIELVWSLWSDTERATYLRDYHHIFQSLCNPMPLRTAQRLLAAAGAGQLRMLGGIVDVRTQGEAFDLVCRDETFRADAVINSAKRETAPSPAAATALCASLVNAGLGQYDDFGGLTVSTADNRLVTAGPAAPSPVFALGQLSAGSLYYTSSLAMIARRVELVADRIAEAVALTKQQ
ncbi:FAD/NAD(P)-binding protein [Streptomyces bambusae]|uniref:FAD/NAD(P)-binding protein n=1 Tax=Streptomyces bambusae TaxID=1550616 RepID=UPI001CFEFD2A|nr:FAD/NAD(P)-binding protein [Streptomyces bambusae]MCB5165020.1 FAD/NAD(P)-binding protein [Streptomyces bambusae]